MANRKKKSTGRTRGNGAGTVWRNPQTGSLFGVISWMVIEHGKPVRKKRARKSVSGTVTEAHQHIKDLLEELDVERRLNPDGDGGHLAHAGRKVNPRTFTFGELAQHHKQDNLTTVEFDEATGIKKSGLLAARDARRTVDKLVAYFGPGKLVSSFTVGQIRKYKTKRLNDPAITRYKQAGSDTWITKVLTDENGKPRTITFATVHRELATLRRMLNFAVGEGWSASNPMRGAKDLIEPANENKRTTIASQVEEHALIDHCGTHEKRKHLAPYLITAFDHGCRSIELRRMLVADVEFENNLFWVHSFKGKKRHDRKLIMTPRVHAALLACCAGKQPEDHVFTYDVKKKNDDGTTTIDHRPLKFAPRRSFKTVKSEAARWSNGAIDLAGFRGHDMRHTQITRAVAGGASLDEVGKAAGHMQPSTTWRYLNPDDSSLQRIADITANYREAEVIPFKQKVKVKKRG